MYITIFDNILQNFLFVIKNDKCDDTNNAQYYY